MRTVIYLYSIKTLRWSDKKGRECEEFVSAPGLEQVLEYLKLDLANEGVEIVSITRHVPILKNL